MLRLKSERLRRGWNQTVVAYRTGLSVADVSRIETGRLHPYPSQIGRLSMVFGLDGASLLEDVGATDNEPLPQKGQSR